MIKIFKSFFPSSSYRLEKDKLSQNDWDSLLLSMEDSNLMQSWQYAEAMKEVTVVPDAKHMTSVDQPTLVNEKLFIF
jgi:hypothetical protein